MKCVLERKHMPLMLISGLVLVFGGVLMACLVSEDAHTLSRIAGFISGLGASLAVIAAAIMIWARIVGEKRAKDSDLAASDERGQMIAGKAQNVLAFAAIFSLIAIVLGDSRRYVLYEFDVGAVHCLRRRQIHRCQNLR